MSAVSDPMNGGSSDERARTPTALGGIETLPNGVTSEPVVFVQKLSYVAASHHETPTGRRSRWLTPSSKPNALRTPQLQVSVRPAWSSFQVGGFVEVSRCIGAQFIRMLVAEL